MQGFAGYGRAGTGTQRVAKAQMSGRVIATAGCIALAASLAGCAAIENADTGNFYVQPGKFQFLKCPDLARRYVDASAREKQIVGLMERANESAAGPLINATVYSVDLKQVRAESQLLQQTMQEKGCSNTVPPPNALPPKK